MMHRESVSETQITIIREIPDLPYQSNDISKNYMYDGEDISMTLCKKRSITSPNQLACGNTDGVCGIGCKPIWKLFPSDHNEGQVGVTVGPNEGGEDDPYRLPERWYRQPTVSPYGLYSRNDPDHRLLVS
jgi:hypothetical protein